MIRVSWGLIMRFRGVILGLMLMAAPATAETVATAARSLKLAAEPGGAGSMVSTAGWGNRIQVVQQQSGDDRQWMQIHYPGSKDLAAGNYWVRRSMLMPVKACTQIPVGTREADTRGAGNGAGTFCKPDE